MTFVDDTCQTQTDWHVSDDVRKQVVANGAIKVIVPVAQSYPNPDVKSEALKALINLALTEENEDAFVDGKAVPMLVATLKTGNAAQKELACLTLENLCLSSNHVLDTYFWPHKLSTNTSL